MDRAQTVVKRNAYRIWVGKPEEETTRRTKT
jgi:hypothetical protein